ncbi:MAG TPA: hypothetical protein VFB59_04425 [Candidatus Saccharimonadales bacterium]|nr:hypothetical protein [Candidatus Saccharimonadales bacterium]
MAEKKKNDGYIATNPQAMFAVVKPYIAGAKVQLERYLEAQRIMKTHKLVLGGGIDRCMYELSALLEHLDCIETQLRNRGINLPTGENIRQFRNHLRHDAGGDTDWSKGKRGQAIGLNDKLLVHIVFADSGVKMGSTELTAQQIDTYITTAETIMWALTLGGRIEIDGETVTIYQQSADITTKNSPEV